MAPPPGQPSAKGAREGAPTAEHDAWLAYHLFEAAAMQHEPAGMVGLAECHLYGRGGVRREPMVGVATFDCRTAARGVCRSRGAGSRKRSREWTLRLDEDEDDAACPDSATDF